MTKKKATNKYSVIEPFIKGEKKLKEIQAESGVSYATLKRWVKSYKDKGDKGLDKKVRKDKNNYKSLNQKTVNLIKELYTDNPNLKISKLYKNFSSLLNKTNEKEVSYQMLYRVVSNLDSFLQGHAELYVNRAKFKNQIFRSDYIEILNFKENTNFFIYFCYDVATFKILHYRISEFKFSFKHYLLFLRETLLRNNIGDSLKEFIIGNFYDMDKTKVKEIKDKLNIEIYPSENSFKEIDDILTYIYDDISTIIQSSEESDSLKSIKVLLDSYLDFSLIDREIPIPLEDNPLNLLLESKKRNIQNYGIRLNNLLYSFDGFKEFSGEKVTLRYSSLDSKYLYVYSLQKYLDIGSLK